MSTLFLIIAVIIAGPILLLFGMRIAIYLFVIFVVCPFLCDIDPEQTYSWYSGIWHGIFFIPNFIRSLVDSSVLYKAADYGTGYNFFWWVFTIQQSLSFFISERKRYTGYN